MLSGHSKLMVGLSATIINRAGALASAGMGAPHRSRGSVLMGVSPSISTTNAARKTAVKIISADFHMEQVGVLHRLLFGRAKSGRFLRHCIGSSSLILFVSEAVISNNFRS